MVSEKNNLIPAGVIPDGVELTADQALALEAVAEWAYDRDELYFTIYGGAGTGKSFLTNMIAKLLSRKYTICVTSITHKAKAVVAKFTGLRAVTMHSILGLAPNMELEEFDINNVVFDKKKQPTVSAYQVIIVDECSMLNDNLFTYLTDQAAMCGTKILFIGDATQLPPVKEEISPTFAKVSNIAYLRQPARQNPTNPLLIALYALRHDIEMKQDSYAVLRDTLTTFNVPPAIKDAVLEEAQVGDSFNQLIYDLPVFINDGEGYQFINDEDDFNAIAHKTFLQSKEANNARIIAYRNATVTQYNKLVRSWLSPGVTEPLTVGDLMMCYRSIGDDDYNKGAKLVNSEDYEVINIEPEISHHTLIIGNNQSVDVEIPGYLVTLRPVNDGLNVVTFIAYGGNYSEFKRAHGYYLNGGRKFKKWTQYYSFKNTVLTIDDLRVLFNDFDNMPAKDFDYARAITAHKSQGSTFTNSLVIGRDIKEAYNIGVHYHEKELKRAVTPEEARKHKVFMMKLLYVALSRASEKAIVLW
jgi:hypothetical protein